MAQEINCYMCLEELAVGQQYVFNCGAHHPERVCHRCGETWLQQANTCPECRREITQVILAPRPPQAEEAPPAAVQQPTLADIDIGWIPPNLLGIFNNMMAENRRLVEENRVLRELTARQHIELNQVNNRIVHLEDRLARRDLTNENLHTLLDNIRRMVPSNRREREEAAPAPRPRAKAKRVGRVVDVDQE